MNPLTDAGDLAGLILLAAALVIAAALTAGRALVRYAAPRRAALAATRAGIQAAASGDGSVEDRIASPAALQLEEAVSPGDQQHAIPQPRGVLATRDR
jgi:hypothetical protein